MSVTTFREALIKLDETNPCRKDKIHSWEPTVFSIVNMGTGELGGWPGFRCTRCRFALRIKEDPLEHGARIEVHIRGQYMGTITTTDESFSGFVDIPGLTGGKLKIETAWRKEPPKNEATTEEGASSG